MRFFEGSRRRLLVLGAAGVLAAALAVPALAQNATETQTPNASDSTTEDPTSGERGAGMRQAFAQALADELELPVERVDDALTAVRERMVEEHQELRSERLQERLDEAVANGDLTQDQADAILQGAEAGVLGGRDGRSGRRGFGHHGGGQGWFGGPSAGDTGPGDGSTENQA